MRGPARGRGERGAACDRAALCSRTALARGRRVRRCPRHHAHRVGGRGGRRAARDAGGSRCAAAALGARDLTRATCSSWPGVPSAMPCSTAVAEERDRRRRARDPVRGSRARAHDGCTPNHILVESRAEAEELYRQCTGRSHRRRIPAWRRRFDRSQREQNAGDLGPIPASEFDPDFAERRPRPKPGEVSQPVQTQFGWHVI